MNEKAIEVVADFYNVTKEEAVELYWDEVEAYTRLLIMEELSNEQPMV